MVEMGMRPSRRGHSVYKIEMDGGCIITVSNRHGMRWSSRLWFCNFMTVGRNVMYVCMYVCIWTQYDFS